MNYDLTSFQFFRYELVMAEFLEHMNRRFQALAKGPDAANLGLMADLVFSEDLARYCGYENEESVPEGVKGLFRVAGTFYETIMNFAQSNRNVIFVDALASLSVSQLAETLTVPPKLPYPIQYLKFKVDQALVPGGELFVDGAYVEIAEGVIEFEGRSREIEPQIWITFTTRNQSVDPLECGVVEFLETEPFLRVLLICDGQVSVEGAIKEALDPEEFDESARYGFWQGALEQLVSLVLRSCYDIEANFEEVVASRRRLDCVWSKKNQKTGERPHINIHALERF